MSGTVDIGLAAPVVLERCRAHPEERRGARTEKQSSDFCRASQCTGVAAGDAGSKLESLATNLRQPDRSRCPKQQPHHGWGIEQSNRLHPSRRWRYGYPTHHGLWAHHEPGCRCSPSGKSRRTERSRYQRRSFVGRGPGFLQRAADTRCAARCGADRSLAAVVIATRSPLSPRAN